MPVKLMPSRAVRLLLMYSKMQMPFSLIVSGISMCPVLCNGDKIVVCSKEVYENGDILVFVYKENEILAHRLLYTDGSCFLCKGDNAFRTEIISKEQIIGAVVSDNDPHKTDEFLHDSYNISKLYQEIGYEQIIQDAKYKQYSEKYLKMEKERITKE